MLAKALEEVVMRLLSAAILTLVAGACACWATAAVAGPWGTGRGTAGFDRPVMLISDCEVDEEGRAYCGDGGG